MPAATRFAALLIVLSWPVQPAGAQAPQQPLPSVTRLAPAPHEVVPTRISARMLASNPPSIAPAMPRESTGSGTAVFTALATGVFFGAMAGGIYGQSQEDCTGCDFWGAVAGGFLGGLVGLASGTVISML